MSTTEKAITKAAAEALGVELAARERRAEELREQIPTLRAAEEEALRESLRTKPKLRPFGDLNSPANKAKRAREKAEAELHGLELEMPYLRSEAEAAARVIAEAEAKKAIRGLAVFPKKYGELWEAMREWHAAGVERWVTELPALKAEMRAYAEEAEPLILAAGLRAEWDDALATNALGDPDKGLPVDFAAAFKQLNAAFHVRDIDGAAADAIREEPELVRPRTRDDDGAAFEPAPPLEFVWFDLATAPQRGELSAIGRTSFYDWNDPTTAWTTDPPDGWSYATLPDGQLRWLRRELSALTEAHREARRAARAPDSDPLGGEAGDV